MAYSSGKRGTFYNTKSLDDAETQLLVQFFHKCTELLRISSPFPEENQYVFDNSCTLAGRH